MKRLYLLYVLAAATLLSGCRKELCYDHDEHAFSVKVDVAATWEQEWERSYDTDWQSVWNPAWSQSYDDLRPGIPTGIRARVYGDGTAEAQINDSYYNMKEKVLPHFHLIERAENAFRANGVEPQCVPIRGGTDGARLSYMGLPCPNLSTGGYNFHGRKEMITVEAREAMVNGLESIVRNA